MELCLWFSYENRKLNRLNAFLKMNCLLIHSKKNMKPNRNLQYLSTFAVALAAMTSSVSSAWTSPVIPKFHNNETDLRLTDTEISWLVSAGSPGVMLGCLVSRYTADTFGRRATLLGSALPYTLGTVLVVTATKAWMLYLARFFWGIGSGGILPISMIYVSEIAAKDIRGSLSVALRFMFNFGLFLVVTVGSIASYQALSYMPVALSICYFVACWGIPETPYYLLKVGKIARAENALMKLNGYAKDKIEEKLEDMRLHVNEEMQNSGTIKELLTGKQYRKAILVSIGLRGTQTMAGSRALFQYIGRILQETNSDISVSTGMILYGATRFITSMVASLLVDKIGRRPLLIWSYTASSLTLACLGVLFYLHEVWNTTPMYFGYVTLCILILSSIVSTLGYDTVNHVIPAEIFPLNVKSTAMTSLNIFVFFLTFCNNRGYQILKDLSGLYGVFWFFAFFAMSGAIFSFIVVPETKGKSLREIQLELQGGVCTEGQNKKGQIETQECETKSRESIDKDNSVMS